MCDEIVPQTLAAVVSANLHACWRSLKRAMSMSGYDKYLRIFDDNIDI